MTGSPPRGAARPRSPRRCVLRAHRGALRPGVGVNVIGDVPPGKVSPMRYFLFLRSSRSCCDRISRSSRRTHAWFRQRRRRKSRRKNRPTADRAATMRLPLAALSHRMSRSSCLSRRGPDRRSGSPASSGVIPSVISDSMRVQFSNQASCLFGSGCWSTSRAPGQTRRPSLGGENTPGPFLKSPHVKPDRADI
jgi:hypothetical protein